MIRTESGRVSRTQVVNAIVLALGALVGLVPTLREVIPAEVYPWAFVGLSVVQVFLRQITSEPMA
jgi:hypothetical protein